MTDGSPNLLQLVVDLYANEGKVVELYLKDGRVIKAGIRGQTSTGVKYIPEEYLRALSKNADPETVTKIHQGAFDSHIELMNIEKVVALANSI